MPSQIGTFATPKARQYLQQLCKHFAHKVSVDYTETEGRAALPPGEATLAATDAQLTITIRAEGAEGLETGRYVIDSHMARFAHREGFESMHWSDPSRQ